MDTIFLHLDDLCTIQQFMKKFPNADTVEINSISTSGIGSNVTASINVNLNGEFVKITKIITDESNW